MIIPATGTGEDLGLGIRRHRRHHKKTLGCPNKEAHLSFLTSSIYKRWESCILLVPPSLPLQCCGFSRPKPRSFRVPHVSVFR